MRTSSISIVAVSENREKQRGKRDDKVEKHRLLTSDAVHQHTRRYGEDEEPEEHQRREYVGLRVGQVPSHFHVVGGDAHQIHKALMAKKQSMTGKSFAKEEFLVFSMLKIIICYFN